MAKDMAYAEAVIQPLMDRAYAQWGEAKSFGEFARSLWGLERKAVLVGKLNQQVCNGGFIQWIDNGYAVLIGELMAVLAEVNTPATLEALRIVRDRERAEDTEPMRDAEARLIAQDAPEPLRSVLLDALESPLGPLTVGVDGGDGHDFTPSDPEASAFRAGS